MTFIRSAPTGTMKPQEFSFNPEASPFTPESRKKGKDAKKKPTDLPKISEDTEDYFGYKLPKDLYVDPSVMLGGEPNTMVGEASEKASKLDLMFPGFAPESLAKLLDHCHGNLDEAISLLELTSRPWNSQSNVNVSKNFPASPSSMWMSPRTPQRKGAFQLVRRV